jgi:hypothetical protein
LKIPYVFLVLGVSEKVGNVRLQDFDTWQDEAVDFRAEFGREAGEEVIL